MFNHDARATPVKPGKMREEQSQKLARSALHALRHYRSAVLICLSLSGCGNYGPDLKAALGRQLSPAWQVDDVRIDEWQIRQHDTSQWFYRFSAKVTPAEDLYTTLGTLNGTAVLQTALKQGTPTELSGKAAAVRRQADWDSHFDFDHAPAALSGAPARVYGNSVFIVGSGSQKEFLDAATEALYAREIALVRDEEALGQRRNEWSSIDASLSNDLRQVESNLLSEQQRLVAKQSNMGSMVGLEVQSADKALRTEMSSQLDKARKEMDARDAAVSQAYSNGMRALQQQYQVLVAQRLPRDEFIERSRQHHDKEVAAQQRYREQLDQSHETFGNQIKGIQQGFEVSRARLREDISQSVKADVERSSAELQEKVQQQQSRALVARDELARQRSVLEQMAGDVQHRREELVRERSLLAQLAKN